MVHFNPLPSWILNYTLFSEIAFAIITFAVCLYSFKIYKLSGEKKSQLFGFAFLFISINYFLQSFLTLAALFKLEQNICSLMKIQDLQMLTLYGIYSHLFFFIIGLITLVYMTLNIKSIKTYILILAISIVSILFSSNKIYIYYVLASILLIYISFYYLMNYTKNKQIKTLLVLIAFLFLLFGNIHFIFSINHQVYYLIGHFLEFIAYLLILLNLFLVSRK